MSESPMRGFLDLRDRWEAAVAAGDDEADDLFDQIAAMLSPQYARRRAAAAQREPPPVAIKRFLMICAEAYIEIDAIAAVRPIEDADFGDVAREVCARYPDWWEPEPEVFGFGEPE